MFKYVLALLPLMSRLTLIAIITLSHSVSWLAYDAPDSTPSGTLVATNSDAPGTPAPPPAAHMTAPRIKGAASESHVSDTPWWRNPIAHLPSGQLSHWSATPPGSTPGYAFAEHPSLYQHAFSTGD
jgi:hypothetical protein